jgi:hypothetical protein
MVVSIGINQFFTIGFFISLNKSEFKTCAFINAVVMVIATYLIFSKKPWKPEKRIPVNRYPVKPGEGERRIWNDQKGEIETIADTPSIDEQQIEMVTRQLSQTFKPLTVLCYR